MLLVAPNQQDPLLPHPAAQTGPARMPSLVGYIKAIADTMLQSHDRFYVEQVESRHDLRQTLAITQDQKADAAELAQAMQPAGQAYASAGMAAEIGGPDTFHG